MTTLELLLSVFHQMGEKVKGKTMLQKIVFILSREFPKATELSNLSFTKYYYGPFSRTLEDIMEDARLQGLIQISERPFNEDVIRYDITVTQEGRTHIERLPSEKVELSKRMASRARELNSKPLAEVVSEAYRLLQN